MITAMRCLLLALSSLSFACAAAPPKQGGPARAPGEVRAELAPDARLARAFVRLEQSRYAEAEADFRAALSGSKAARALLGLSELLTLTGRYAEAITVAQRALAGRAEPSEAALAEARALRATGEVEAALSRIAGVAANERSAALRLLHGELLLELGRRRDAEPILLTLIADYNADRVPESDGAALARVGRAAHLLRSPRDANELFDSAERATPGNLTTLLYRAELFLEKHDPGHAEEVLSEALQTAPRHPVANMLLAEVRLAQALDFDEAERLARLALAQNPKLAHAFFVLAGIAVRDQELALADSFVAQGLRSNPRDLPLLSMRAAVRFLADDDAGFRAQKQHVLKLNPEYTRFYTIVGEFADWEHRYDEIVLLMQEAVALDQKDAKAEAELGLNLIRAGNDAQGLLALNRSFALDPYNVRVFNTLEMYEHVIAKEYESVQHPRFVIRYKKTERALLDRYVPELLGRAFDVMQKSYGFTPETPIGVELYAERENFGIRTSGLPQIAIQGVCFGKTLASMSPERESFNLGMTLWHELSHVFHIQMSKSRVPRWFTEGLAEYETIVARPEWVRENDQELFEALRRDRLPALGNMSRAFTRAEELADVGMAYYASSQILVMLAERYGYGKLSEMLRQWGAGKNSAQVLEQVLGQSPAALDAEFRRFAEQKLARFRTQFMPLQRKGNLERARELAKKHPGDLRKRLELVLLLLEHGQRDEAEKLLSTIERKDPTLADARFLRAELVQGESPERAIGILRRMIAERQDGYAVRLLLGRIYTEQGKAREAEEALLAAAGFDPLAATPHYMLAELAQLRGDVHAELSALRRLAELEQHENKVYRRLLRLLVENRAWEEAVKIGEAAVFADMAGLTTHRLFGEALAQVGNTSRAVFELESAALAPGDPAEHAAVQSRLAELYATAGRARDAEQARKKARQLAAEASAGSG
jgi:tetratricopeptide (TPR) repeat protein